MMEVSYLHFTREIVSHFKVQTHTVNYTKGSTGFEINRDEGSYIGSHLSCYRYSF